MVRIIVLKKENMGIQFFIWMKKRVEFWNNFSWILWNFVCARIYHFKILVLMEKGCFFLHNFCYFHIFVPDFTVFVFWNCLGWSYQTHFQILKIQICFFRFHFCRNGFRKCYGPLISSFPFTSLVIYPLIESQEL